VRLLAAVSAALLIAGCGASGPTFKNADITGAEWGREFSLTDHTGKPRTLADFRGKVVVVFFGYVRCPDVCPTTLAELKSVVEQLGQVQHLLAQPPELPLVVDHRNDDIAV